MSRDKQIEEMARTICNCYDSGICEIDEKPCDLECGSVKNAKELYAKGYRKASEDALEVITEMEEVIKKRYHDNKNSLYDSPLITIHKHSARHSFVTMLHDIAELKKKYTEEGK